MKKLKQIREKLVKEIEELDKFPLISRDTGNKLRITKTKLQQHDEDVKVFEEVFEDTDVYECYEEMLKEKGKEDIDQHWCMMFAGKIITKLKKELRE